MKPQIGIIGCGGVAGIHMRGYSQCPDIQLVACCDYFIERAKAFAATHNIPRAYDDYRKMIESEELDGVSIGTPNYVHMEPTILALEAGINVLCEKPIAMNATEALQMVEAAKRSKAFLTIGHHFRFQPFAQYLKRMIDRGELGDIYYGRSQALRRRGVPGWGEFHIKSKSGGGPLIDLGVHTLDFIIWLMGSPQPRTVSGKVYTHFGNRPEFYTPHGSYQREDFDVEDFACGFVKFTNDASLTLEASWAAHLPEMETYPQTLLGDKGGAVINPFISGENALRIYTAREESLMDLHPHGFPAVEPHVEEIKYWIKCVKGEAEILVKPEEALNVQQIIDGLYMSSECGHEIIISNGDLVPSQGECEIDVAHSRSSGE